ncbi:MAG TPA: hypothetical protein VFW21_11790 [Mycobacterium sp.]|nr:hypothetical protein [Mycobacterium sp.]
MDTHDYVTYEQWGRKFFEVAVTNERVAAAFGAIAGDQIEIGPMAQGPAGLARVSAKVNIGEPHATRRLGDTITFDIRIPLTIDLLVDLRLDKQRFTVAGEVALRAIARAAEPLALVLDVAKPRPSDISVHVSSTSFRGEIVRIIGGVDAEIRRFTAQHVADQIDAPESKQAQVIDVESMIDTAWTGI